MTSPLFQDADFSQNFLRTRMKKFIERLGESFPEWTTEGLCSGYVFMLMRAELSGKNPKFFSRLSTLSNAMDDDIVQMTQLIKKFNTKQKQLISSTFSELKNQINTFEDELKQIQKNIMELENEEKIAKQNHSVTLNKLRESKTLLSQKIADKRKIYFDNIEKRAKDSFEDEERVLLEQAQDIYYFIHSLLAAFNPGKHFNLLDEKGEMVHQSEFSEILSLLPSDDLKLDEKTPVTNKNPIRQALSFQFGYTEKELANILNKTILENDLVRLNSTSHAIYLKKQNNKFILYDPNSKKGAIEFTSADEVAKKIISCFYEWKEKKPYNLVSINIFERNSESPPARPSIKTLLSDLFKGRNQDKTNNSVNDLGEKNYTILHMAAKARNTELIQELVQEWGADPRIINVEGQSPISFSSLRGHDKSVEIMTNAVIAKHGEIALQQIGCVPIGGTKELKSVVHEDTTATTPSEVKQKEIQCPLILAAKQGHVNIVKFLIGKNADVNLENETGTTPITAAIEKGQITVLRELLEGHKGLVDQQNKDAQTPLYVAVTNNQSECIKVLVQHHADLDKLNYKNSPVVLFAAHAGNEHVLQTLADLKADLNKTDSNLISALHLAAQKDHLDVVKLLIERKVNLDQPNKSGQTPFMLAAIHDHPAIIKQLAATNSIDFYREDKSNLTPILVAAQKGHIQVIKELINIRVDINKPNKRGVNPICMAAKFSKTEVVRQLVESKADINYETSFGASPMSLAIEQSSSDIVEILVENKADVNKKLKNGMTPVQFAMNKIESNIVAILAKYDANFDFVAAHPEEAVKFLFTISSPTYITQNSFLQRKLQTYSKELTAAAIQYIESIKEKADQLSALQELKTQQNALGAVLQSTADLEKVVSHFEKPDQPVTAKTLSINVRP